ncbi:BTAD domain-containing putative transcriptional regulator [Streptomyces sp. NPDC058773]|uniref:AfsR/SARP family transcriptional regulator n=1 Tax=Streptomyces sp. NPDC058773 TaxID=3346632 RepID=UPI00369F9AE3
MLSSNKQKQLISLLLFNLPHPTSTAMIIDELWTDGPPKSATGTLQTYVCHLRNFLADLIGVPSSVIAAEFLVHRPPGYFLEPSWIELDVQHLREAERRAYAGVDTQDFGAVVQHCESALSLWSGQTLMNVEAGQHVQAEIDGLERARMSLVEVKIEAEISLGRNQKVLGELSKLTSQFPLHEGVHYNYMRALSNSGYRTRSLEIFQTMRTAMVEQLGIEPSLKLQHLHQSILNGRPADFPSELMAPGPLRKSA